MKKMVIFTALLLSFNFILAQDNEEDSKLLLTITKNENKTLKKINIQIEEKREKEAGKIELARIFFENGEEDKAVEELNKIGEKEKNFYYYLLKGKILRNRGDIKGALENLKRAEENDKENIECKIILFEIYSENSGYIEEKKEQKESLLKIMSDQEKEEFYKLEKKYENKNKSEFLGEIYTGITYNDNVKNSKENKEGDLGIISGVMAGGVIEYEKYKRLYIAAAYKNTLYFKENDETVHNFILTLEPVKQYKKWSGAIPLVFRYSLGNNETIDKEILTGIKWSRKISKRSVINTGIDIGYLNNNESDYSGAEIYPYVRLKWRSRYKIEYDTELKIKEELYDKDEYQNMGIIWNIKSQRVIKEKYKLTCSYGIGYSRYKIKLSEDNKKEINSRFGIEGEIPLGRYGLKGNIGYSFENNSSNADAEDYTCNKLYIKAVKEF